MGNPLAYATIDEPAMHALMEKAKLDADYEMSELSNSERLELIHKEFNRLVEDFWCNFTLQYTKLIMEERRRALCK
jgi:hypothetical protein